MRSLTMMLCLFLIGCAGKMPKTKVAKFLEIRSSEEDFPRVVAKNVQNGNIVFLYVRNKEGVILGSASGFVVDKNGLIATAKHVMDAARGHQLYAVINEGGKITVRYVFGDLSHPDADVALLIVRHQFKSEIPIRLARLLPNEKLFAVGFPMTGYSGNPLKLTSTVSHGNFFKNIKHALFTKRSQYYILAHLPIANGASGGIVFDRYGNAVGIITGYMSEPNMAAYSFTVISSPAYIKALLLTCKFLNCA